MKIRKQTLRNQLLIYITLLVIALSIIIAGVISNLSNRLITKQIGNSRIDVLKQIGERISGVKNSMMYVLSAISANQDIQNWMLRFDLSEDNYETFMLVMEGIIDQLDNAFDSSDFQYNIECYSENGISFSSKGSTEKNISEIRNELWFKELQKDAGQVLWVGSSLGQMQREGSMVTAIRAVRGETGDIVGVILISINETLFGNTYENVLNQKNEIFIVDETGKIVSSNRKEWIGLRYFNMDKLSELIGHERYSLISNRRGEAREERLVSAVLDESSAWTMVEFIKAEEIFSEMKKVTVQIECFVIAVIGLACAWGWYFSNKMVKPLKELERDIEKVKNGDIYVETEIKGWREIYELRDDFNAMMAKIQELMENIKNKEKEKHKLELDFLQAQINPHFLYNTLFSIKCLVEMNENENAAVMISDFIELLRLVLKKEGEYITLEKELECVKKYGEIQKYRYAGKFEVYFDIPSDCRKLFVPKLILQPIMENAIFHGIEPKDGCGLIVISAKKEAGELRIRISDDGVGMDDEMKTAVLCRTEVDDNGGNNIGIRNVNSRIHLLYGENYGIAIESEPDFGTTVIIDLPCSRGE